MATARKLEQAAAGPPSRGAAKPTPSVSLRPGTRLVREWHGVTHMVLILADGIEWRGQRYRSLSVVARKITGARWSGPRFFGLRQRPLEFYLQPREQAMARADPARAGLTIRCAIYTRKSSDEGLEQEFNSRRPAGGVRGLHREPASCRLRRMKQARRVIRAARLSWKSDVLVDRSHFRHSAQ